MGRPKRLHLLGKTGQQHPRWKNGRHINQDGYVRALCSRHPWPRAHHYMFEHVMIVELSIGRRILPTETVHHLNGDRQDNRLENLRLMARSEHMSMHAKERVALGRKVGGKNARP